MLSSFGPKGFVRLHFQRKGKPGRGTPAAMFGQESTFVNQQRGASSLLLNQSSRYIYVYIYIFAKATLRYQKEMEPTRRPTGEEKILQLEGEVGRNMKDIILSRS